MQVKSKTKFLKDDTCNVEDMKEKYGTVLTYGTMAYQLKKNPKK